jgi:hypothetical protein
MARYELRKATGEWFCDWNKSYCETMLDTFNGLFAPKQKGSVAASTEDFIFLFQNKIVSVDKFYAELTKDVIAAREYEAENFVHIWVHNGCSNLPNTWGKKRVRKYN